MNVATIIFACLSAVLMGTIGVFAKITGLPAEVITFFRLILGAGFMLIFLMVTGKLQLVRSPPSWPVAICGCFLAGFIIFYIQAMNFTSMANAIILVYLAPVAASVVAHFFLSERLTPLAFGLILLALLGFGMMMEFRIEISQHSSEFIGICFGLLALGSYAGFILSNRVISPHIHVYTSTFYQLLIGAVTMIPFSLHSAREIKPEHILWLLGIGFFPGFLAILFAVIALSRLPAATFGTIAYIEPVAVVIFGWILFNESMNPLQMSGCLLIILSGITNTLTVRTESLQ